MKFHEITRILWSALVFGVAYLAAALAIEKITGQSYKDHLLLVSAVSAFGTIVIIAGYTRWKVKSSGF